MKPIVLRTRRLPVWAVGILLAVAGGTGCSSDALGPEASAVESVVVAPPSATVAVGSSLTLSAEVLDGSGEVLPSVRVTWATENASIAEVSPSGVVTGRRVGTVLIAASSRGKDAFARITVNPTPVANVRLSAAHRAMLVGQSAQLTAEALDAGGRVLADRPITWTTSDATVASVNEAGVVTALAAGAAIVTAVAEGRSAVATITVSEVPAAVVTVAPATASLVVGQTTQLTAQVKDGAGGVLGGRMITWSTNRANVATVTSTGLVTAVSPGSATITATSEGRSGSATITVSARPVSAVIVSPGQVTIFAAQTVQLSALVTDDRGQVLTGRPIAFSSSNTQIATVSSQGVVTGIAEGTVTITATSEGASGRATVTVAPDPVFVVDVTPATSTIVVGNSVQLVATPRNASGQPLTGRTVTWSSNTPTRASVSSSGMVTGISTGSAVIVATVDGKQGTAAVTVRPVPVATITVTPATVTTVPGQSVTLSVSTLDATGNMLTGRIVGWSSSDNSVATVSSSGVVTGVGGGTATITASSEGQSGTSTVTVGSVPVATVVVNPAQASLAVGQTVTLTATPQDASGQSLTGRSVAWSSSASNIATVSAAGVVTGVSAGAVSITATIDGVAGSATITVNAPTAASVTVAPATVTVAIGATSPLSATVRDAGGNVMSGASVTWTSGNTAVATVSATGVVSAVSSGTAVITATSGSASGTATVTVPAPAVNRIVVTPQNPNVDEGSTIQLTATVYDASNRVMTGVTLTWTSSRTDRATVDSTGLVRAKKNGNAVITAAGGGKSGSTTVRVQDDDDD